YWPRGKTLGGCSSINAMVYLRGHREDFDGWARLGNQGWGYADVLPLFKRSEHNERGADDYHGTGGPLNVADLRDPHPLTGAFLGACAEAGLPRNPDCNGREQDRAGPAPPEGPPALERRRPLPPPAPAPPQPGGPARRPHPPRPDRGPPRHRRRLPGGRPPVPRPRRARGRAVRRRGPLASPALALRG